MYRVNFNEWFSKAIKSLEQSQVKPGHYILVCAEDKKIKRIYGVLG